MRNPTFALCGVVALAFGAAPAADAVTLALVPEQSTFQAASMGIVDVVASGLTDAVNGGSIGAYDFDITFDPSILAYSSTTFGSGLNVTGQGDIQGSGVTAPGKLETLEVSFDTAKDLAALQPDSFVLFSLTFAGVSSGTSALDLSILSMSDGSGISLGADVHNASVTVTPVPLPAAVWLLLSAVGGALGFRRLQPPTRFHRCP
jgi:hypothetical protein